MAAHVKRTDADEHDLIVRRSLDWMMLATVVLCCLGLIMAVSVSGPKPGVGALLAMKSQGARLAVGLFAFLAMAMFPLHLLWRFAGIAFWVSTGFVYFAAFFGTAVNGARRWIHVAGMQFQPVDVARMFAVIYVARCIAQATQDGQLQNFRGTVRIMLPPLVLSVGLLLQPDNGNAVFVLALCCLMALVAGFSIRHFALVAIPGLCALIVAALQKSYVVERLTGFLSPEVGGQVWQSMVAISSGGLVGQGLGNGWMKMGFVPEAQNDFVFAIIGEELGLLGSFLVLFLYTTVGVMGLRLVLRCKDRFLRSLVFGFIVAICTQASINLLVVTGLAPAKGIDLPFLSSGGTSLVVYLAAVGLIGNAVRADARFYSGRQ